MDDENPLFSHFLIDFYDKNDHNHRWTTLTLFMIMVKKILINFFSTDTGCAAPIQSRSNHCFYLLIPDVSSIFIDVLFGS